MEADFGEEKGEALRAQEKAKEKKTEKSKEAVKTMEVSGSSS
jgi:hypothetical protein